MGNALCRQSDYYSWNVWRPHGKIGKIEKWSRVKGIEGGHGENQSYDLDKRSPYIANLW